MTGQARRIGTARISRQRARRPMRRMAIVVVALLLAGLFAVPADANAASGVSAGPVGATAADAVNPSFLLSTRVVAATPVEPDDQLQVTVGDQTYPAPTSATGSCPTRIWVLVLDRASLDETSSTAYPLCTAADTTQLTQTLTSTPNTKMVIVNSLGGRGGLRLVLAGLGAALATIGATAADFAALDLGRAAFSVYGIPGLSAGQAYTNTDDVPSESTVAAGAPTAASINGTLVQDNHSNFALTMPDYAGYDIAADPSRSMGTARCTTRAPGH